MMAIAEWLPIFLIPEEFLIASMGNDVVDYNGCRRPVLLEAFNTQWMLPEISPARLVPSVSITAVIRTISQVILRFKVGAAVIFTMAGAVIGQIGAAWLSTWSLRFIWHLIEVGSCPAQSVATWPNLKRLLDFPNLNHTGQIRKSIEKEKTRAMRVFFGNNNNCRQYMQ